MIYIIILKAVHHDIPDDAREAFMNLVYDELCTDGDNNRANRIIDAADEYVEYSLAKQSAQPEIIDGRLFVTVDDIKKVGCVLVDEHKSNFCRQFYMDAQAVPCDDAVSRKAVQYLLAYFVDEDKYVDACDGLKHLPPVTPKQRTGKWILVTDNNGQHFVCNKCGEWRYHQRQKFCGECGAKMKPKGKE